MAVPFILYNNILELGTPVATSEEPGFDIENITDWRTYLRWKSTGGAVNTITIDAGSPVSVDSLGISGHNIFTVDGRIVVSSSDTGAFSGEEVTRMTVFIPSSNDPIVQSFSSATARYWEIRLSSLTDKVEIGVVCLGARLDFPKNPNRPLSFVDESMEATTKRSKNGHILGATTYYRPYSTVLSFSWLQISFVMGDLYTFWSTHGSLLKPFFLQVNIDQWDVGRFVQLPENYVFREVFDDYTFTTDLQMTFEGIL